MYNGHKGWVNCLITKDDFMFSGGDDMKIIVWNIESGKSMDILSGHENSITSIQLAFGDLYSGSYDHHIICWDLDTLEERLEEKEMMRQVHIESMQIEVWKRQLKSNAGK